MSDILDQLKQDIENLPLDASDPNIIASIVEEDYHKNRLMLDTIYVSIENLYLTDIVSATDYLDQAHYDEVISAFDDLTAIINQSPKYDYKVDSSIDITTDMTTEEQIRFLGSVNQTTFDLILYMKENSPDESVDLPSAMGASIDRSLYSLKDKALADYLGYDSYHWIIEPLMQYQDYIDSNDVITQIERLANMELFLIPKYRSPDNFIVGNELYSNYYRSKFYIDKRGKLQVNKLSPDTVKQSRLHNVLANIENYYG